MPSRLLLTKKGGIMPSPIHVHAIYSTKEKGFVVTISTYEKNKEPMSLRLVLTPLYFIEMVKYLGKVGLAYQKAVQRKEL